MERRFLITTPATRFTPRPDDHVDTHMGDGTGSHQIVSTGQLIASAKDWMRGHGTFLDEAEDEDDDESGDVRSSVVGTVERVNKLISVRALRGRYRPDVGDLVIGRICEVQAKRWKVEAGARQDAVLMLGSVNLPGGVQRRKLESDELQMRTFFQEGDLLVAEVQAFFADGAMSLHTRSLKYGKLRNGVLVQVPSQLIVRLKSHFHSLSCGVDLILGLNGYIWVSKRTDVKVSDEGLDGATSLMYTDQNEDISPTTFTTIARVASCITILADYALPISDQSIVQIYDVSLDYADSPDMLLRPEVREHLVMALGQ